MATLNVRSMALDGKHGIVRAGEVMSALKKSCDVIGIQETRCSGQSIFVEAGYTVYYSSGSGGESRKKGKVELD